MKLPIIIFENTQGFVINIPDDEFKAMIKNGRRIDRDELLTHKKAGNKIPEHWEHWKKPVKRFTGIVYGLSSIHSITDEADTEEELIEELKARAMEMCRGFAESARKDWPQNYKITEIEI